MEEVDEWVENFVMCKEIICEIVSELGKPREQVPPVAVRENINPEKIQPA